MDLTHRVQAAARLLDTSVDSVRRYVDESGLDVKRQENGPKARLFTLENIFYLADWRRQNRPTIKPKRQVLATVYAPKGGVGKTTLAANLACLFPLMGLKTLVIDLDFQANLTMAMGYDPEMTEDEAAEFEVDPSRIVEHHFGHLVKGYPEGEHPLSRIVKMPFGPHGPHVIPADLTLDRLETVLTFVALNNQNSDRAIADVIYEGLQGTNPDLDLSGYDVILFDAAPAKSRVTRGALLASDYVIAPVAFERFSTKAVSYLAHVLNDLYGAHERSSKMIMVGNFHTPKRLRVYSQISTLSQEYPGQLLEAMIHRSEDFPRTLSADDYLPPLALTNPSLPASEQLREVARELLQKMEVVS